MGENYFSVKLAVTPLSNNCYRSRIEHCPLGASSGPGCDFSLDKNVALNGALSVAQFQSQMAGGAFSSRLEIEKFGKSLFGLIFKDTVLAKYSQCNAVARERNARLRLCLAMLDPTLIDVPWEYLHDGEGFLLTACSIVRVIDDLREEVAQFGPMQRLLVAIANPQTDRFPQFKAEVHRENLEKLLDSIGGLKVEYAIPASTERLRSKLSGGSFDALYFIGHGVFSPGTAGQLVCEADNHTEERLDANDLAQWLAEAVTCRFVYLNSCSTAQTATDNPFRGVAQRLMREGKVAAVVAMQTEVEQQAAQNMAKEFFDQLRRGSSPEQALLRARTQSDDFYSRGVPVIYTYLSGPEEYDRNRLACLLSATRERSKYALLLPVFREGVPAERSTPPKRLKKRKGYRYPGETFARRDMMAAWHIIGLVNRIAPSEDIQIRPYSESPGASVSHVFCFGSRSNQFATDVLKDFSPSFEFEYLPTKWVLKDLTYKKRYEVRDPSQLTPGEYDRRQDFGVIQKIPHEESRCIFFIIAGLGDRATEGCGLYLSKNWENLLTEFGGGEFAVLLKFPPGMGPDFPSRVDRTTGREMTTTKTGRKRVPLRA